MAISSSFKRERRAVMGSEARVDEGEWEAASRFAALLSEVRGADVGEITEHDAASDLRVDFTLDDASPPAAVELTTIRDVAHTRTFGSSGRLETALSQVAQTEHLGRFAVAVDGTADLRALEVEIPTLMRRMVQVRRKVFRPGHYGTEDLQVRRTPREQRLFEEEHARLRELGLIDLSWHDGAADRVDVATMSDFDLVSLEDELRHAIEGNSAKLEEARGLSHRETHLAVIVDPHGAPEDTPVPELPASVDFLWLLLRVQFRPGRPYVWWIARGDADWRTVHRW